MDANGSSLRVSEDDITQQPHAFHLELIGKTLLRGSAASWLRLPAPSQLVLEPFKVLLLDTMSIVCS